MGGFSANEAALRAMFTARSPIRSRSLFIFSTATTKRRSIATGWYSASVFRHSSSTSTSRRSISASRRSTLRASSASRSNSARIAVSTCSSTIAQSDRTCFLRCSISRCKCSDMEGVSCKCELTAKSAS